MQKCQNLVGSQKFAYLNRILLTQFSYLRLTSTRWQTAIIFHKETRMKKTTSILLALLFVAAVFGNCKEEEKDDNTVLALLLYANDQLSGNCATVTRNSSTSYSATITSVPKGGCKVASTKAEYEESIKTVKTKVLGYYTNQGASCNSSAAIATTQLDNLITTSNNKSDATFAADVEKQRAFTVGNLVTETALTLKNTDGRTDAQIAAMKPGTLEQYFLSTAIAYANAIGATSCVNLMKNIDLEGATGLTSNPPTIITSKTCTYGSSASATTKCATLNTEF